MASSSARATPDIAVQPARRLGRPPGVDGEDTIRRILTVAERQFAAVGYGSTTNKTIADECGLSSAAIHHHIGTKVMLYEAVSDSVHPAMLAAFRHALAQVTGFRNQLTAMLDVSIALNTARPSLAGFVMGAPVEARRHPELADVVNRHFGALEQLVAALVDAAKQAGDIPVAAVTGSVVNMVLSIMHGFAHLAYRQEATELYADAIRTFEALLDGSLVRG
jgi:AcrR family transcriptional regulator